MRNIVYMIGILGILLASNKVQADEVTCLKSYEQTPMSQQCCSSHYQNPTVCIGFPVVFGYQQHPNSTIDSTSSYSSDIERVSMQGSLMLKTVCRVNKTTYAEFYFTCNELEKSPAHYDSKVLQAKIYVKTTKTEPKLCLQNYLKYAGKSKHCCLPQQNIFNDCGDMPFTYKKVDFNYAGEWNSDKNRLLDPTGIKATWHLKTMCADGSESANARDIECDELAKNGEKYGF